MLGQNVLSKSFLSKWSCKQGLTQNSEGLVHLILLLTCETLNLSLGFLFLIINNCSNSYTYIASLQQLELDMEQQTGSKYKKEYVKAVYCRPAYLAYMQSTS